MHGLPNLKMDANVQSWDQTAVVSMEAHRLTATEEISGYRQWWENDGSHVLGQRRRDTHSLRSQEYSSDAWDLWRSVTNEVSSSTAWKTAPKRLKNGPKRLQLFSFITTTLLLIGRLVFTSFATTTTLKLFLMPRAHLTYHQEIFGCFQHWRTLFVVTHFRIVPLLQQPFSSGHNEPLKKCLLRPCNRGVSVVKNVYVYRVIMCTGWLCVQGDYVYRVITCTGWLCVQGDYVYRVIMCKGWLRWEMTAFSAS